MIAMQNRMLQIKGEDFSSWRKILRQRHDGKNSVRDHNKQNFSIIVYRYYDRWKRYEGIKSKIWIYGFWLSNRSCGNVLDSRSCREHGNNLACDTEVFPSPVGMNCHDWSQLSCQLLRYHKAMLEWRPYEAVSYRKVSAWCIAFIVSIVLETVTVLLYPWSLGTVTVIMYPNFQVQ